MAKKVIQMYDKYKSTTKIYPKVIKDCLQEDVTDYIEGQVVANPTLAGTEAELTGIQVGETKYKVGGGKQSYQHNITFTYTDTANAYYYAQVTIISNDATPYDYASLNNYLDSKGYKGNDTSHSGMILAIGEYQHASTDWRHIIGIYGDLTNNTIWVVEGFNGTPIIQHGKFLRSGGTLTDFVIAL